jgi:hypothetical protein
LALGVLTTLREENGRNLFRREKDIRNLLEDFQGGNNISSVDWRNVSFKTI